jgi:hypothetical protein
VIASPRTERLLDLQKVAALHALERHRPGKQRQEKQGRGGARGPLGTLLERYAWQVLGLEPPPVSASAATTRAWCDRVRSKADTEISEIRADDDTQRQRIARKLSRLSPSERAWGQAPPGQHGPPRQRTPPG